MIPSPSLTVLSLGSVHLSCGVMSAKAVQVRVYILPASVGVEGPKIVTMLFNSEWTIKLCNVNV